MALFYYQIEVLAEEEEAIGQLYNLIDTYSIPMPPEDPFVCASLKPAISTLEGHIYDAAWAEKDLMEKFRTSLKKDIKDLTQEIMKVDHKSQVVVWHIIIMVMHCDFELMIPSTFECRTNVS